MHENSSLVVCASQHFSDGAVAAATMVIVAMQHHERRLSSLSLLSCQFWIFLELSCLPLLKNSPPRPVAVRQGRAFLLHRAGRCRASGRAATGIVAQAAGRQCPGHQGLERSQGPEGFAEVQSNLAQPSIDQAFSVARNVTTPRWLPRMSWPLLSKSRSPRAIRPC